MQSIVSLLTEVFGKYFEELGYSKTFGRVEKSNRPELSQYQCNGALAIAGKHKKKPHEIAKSIVEKLSDLDIFTSISINGPGYINISVTDAYLLKNIISIYESIENPKFKKNKQKVIIDFGGMNIAKPMHIGHLRSLIIGESLQRLFKYMGDEVISDNHLGDWGTQMGMVITEIERRYPSLPYFNDTFNQEYPKDSPVTVDELNELYPSASKLCKEEPDALKQAQLATADLQNGRPGYIALWNQLVNVSVTDMKRDINHLSIHFDLWLGESRYQNKIPEMLNYFKDKGFTTLSEGALIIPIEDGINNTEVPPLLLVKSDGGYLYATTDLATILERVNNLDPDNILYIVDKRQSLHFDQVFLVAKKTGIVTHTCLEHIGFGTVNDTSGKPFKTRAGGAMRLKELIQLARDSVKKRMKETGLAENRSLEEIEEISRIVGIGALKYADLKNNRTNNYIFDINKFTSFEGNTGPYILYAAVRIKSILRKAGEKNLFPGDLIEPVNGKERELELKLLDVPMQIEKAYIKRCPHILCELAYDVATVFSSFYNECHILNENDKNRQASWLKLSSITLKILNQILDILGIEIPEKM